MEYVRIENMCVDVNMICGCESVLDMNLFCGCESVLLIWSDATFDVYAMCFVAVLEGGATD